MFSSFNENQTAKDTLQTYIQRKLSPFDHPTYAFTVVSKKKPSDILIISNYPDEWVKQYRENNFQLTDPVILSAFKRTSPFAWDENLTLMLDLRFSRIFSLSRRYHIVNGFTFVLHDHMDNLALLSLTLDDSKRRSIESLVSSVQGDLQMLLIDFNEKIYRPQCRDKNNNRTIFTQRESEMLYWSSMGKTYAEIAMIAGISVSTVKFHIKNVVTKLGVSNSRQAIRLGVELDLIKPVAPVDK